MSEYVRREKKTKANPLSLRNRSSNSSPIHSRLQGLQDCGELVSSKMDRTTEAYTDSLGSWENNFGFLKEKKLGVFKTNFFQYHLVAKLVFFLFQKRTQDSEILLLTN